jgi:serine/arginine repetitive matrix protein 2
MFAMFKGEPDREREAGTSGSGSRDGRVTPSGPRKQIAKITLQIFRLPPLNGLRAEDLPGCIDDCLRGMRHHAWHEGEYHEGILTQEGGDCAVRCILSPSLTIMLIIGIASQEKIVQVDRREYDCYQ